MIPVLLAAALAGTVDAAGLTSVVASHKGRPVLVSLWATWCAPCIEEFPDLEALARERKDVVLIAVSIDDPGDRGALEAFVLKRRPPFAVYARASGSDEDFIRGVDPAWSGAVPAILVYDAAGKRAGRLEGEHRRADLDKVLAKLKP